MQFPSLTLSKVILVFILTRPSRCDVSDWVIVKPMWLWRLVIRLGVEVDKITDKAVNMVVDMEGDLGWCGWQWMKLRTLDEMDENGLRWRCYNKIKKREFSKKWKEVMVCDVSPVTMFLLDSHERWSLKSLPALVSLQFRWSGSGLLAVPYRDTKWGAKGPAVSGLEE